MGSIPALISTDLVHAAGTPVGGMGVQPSPSSGSSSSTSDGFGQMFAVQIADVVATDAAVALRSVTHEPFGPSLPTVTGSVESTAFLLEGLTLLQLLDVNSVAFLDGRTTSASSLGSLTEVAASPVPATGTGLIERTMPPAPSRSFGLMSTDVGASTQARLLQTLSSPSNEEVPHAGSLAESTKESSARAAPEAPEAPIDVGTATWQEPSATSGFVIAPPVARRTHLSSVTTTVAEVASREDVSSEWSGEPTPLVRSSNRDTSLLARSIQSVPDAEKNLFLSAEMSRSPAMPSLSLGVLAPPDKLPSGRAAAIRADGDATAESTATPAAQPTVSTAATPIPQRPDSDSFMTPASLAPIVVDETTVTAVMIPPAGPPGSQIRTSEPSAVSERARLQDPLRDIDPANQSTSAATSSTAMSSTPPATAIPFAMQTVSGGWTGAILPNPLERNIARQLTQQLSAPLGSLAGPGAQRKAAVDKSLIIRLTPPDLGTVRIEISQRNGDLTIRMYAEDLAVRQAIERMLPSLRTDLRQADSPLQHITVESSGSEERGSGERNSGERNSGERNSGERNSGDRNSSDRNGAEDRNAWQGQQQRQDRAPDGDRQPSHRDGERPVFSLSGMPVPEPIAVAPRSRSLGGRSSTTGVDALA